MELTFCSWDVIDMLFIGPNDLAASMGYWGPDHAKIPEVQEATARVLKAAKDNGKYAGHFALSADIGKFLPHFSHSSQIAKNRASSSRESSADSRGV